MYTNHRHYILLIFALAALVLSVLGFSLLRGNIISQAIESAQAIKDAALIDDQKQHAEEIARKYEKSADDRTKLGSYIVTEDKIVNLIEEIEDIGIRSGAPLELSGITTEPGTASKGVTFNTLKARVAGKGSWSSLMQALILLENMPYALSLNNVRLEVSGESSVAELPIKNSKTKPATKQTLWHLTLDIKVLTTKQ